MVGSEHDEETVAHGTSIERQDSILGFISQVIVMTDTWQLIVTH